MIVHFEECNATDTGLFQDIADHKKVTEWIHSIMEKDCHFWPLDFGVMINGKSFSLIRAGETVSSPEEVISEIKKLPTRFNRMPNDWLKIRANAFERELFIKINVPFAK